MPTLELILPYPPTTNHYWRHVGNKVLISLSGRHYRSNVQKLLLLQRVKPIEGRLAVEVDVYPPDARRRDLDNIQKSLLDSLKHGGAYLDDSQIDDLHTRRCEKVLDGKVVVRIRELDIPEVR